MEAGAEDPEPGAVRVLDPIVIAHQLGLFPLVITWFRSPPFGADALGPGGGAHAMHNAAPAEQDGRIVGYRRGCFDQISKLK